MTGNNNVKQNAVFRLAKIPIVRSACALLSGCYADTKGRSSSLKSVCSLLESSVMTATSVAYVGFSPVIDKMEPQLFIVNDLTCRGLDWLENAFPVLQEPTEELTANARNKMLEVKDMVSIVGKGTMTLVQHSITWVFGKMQLRLAIGDVAVGDVTNGALNMSAALKDRLLPHAAGERAKGVQGFEDAAVGTRKAERLVSLCCQSYHDVSTKMHHVKVEFGRKMEVHGYHDLIKQQMEVLCIWAKSPHLIEQLLTHLLSQVWALQDLPQQLQHQAMCAFFFVSQMYHLICPMPQQQNPNLSPSRPMASLDTAVNTSVGSAFVSRSPPGNVPVRLRASTNGKPKKKPVKLPVKDACHAKREIVFK